MVCLAGSEAEVLRLGERPTGAANDFAQASAIARRMLLAGLTELGGVEARALTKDQMFGAMQATLGRATARVRALLEQQEGELSRLADTLLAEETGDGATLRSGMAAPAVG